MGNAGKVTTLAGHVVVLELTTWLATSGARQREVLAARAWHCGSFDVCAIIPRVRTIRFRLLSKGCGRRRCLDFQPAEVCRLLRCLDFEEVWVVRVTDTRQGIVLHKRKSKSPVWNAPWCGAGFAVFSFLAFWPTCAHQSCVSP